MSPCPGSPTGPICREMSIFRAFFYIIPGAPNKQGLLMKQNLAFPSKFPVEYPLLHGHPMGPLWRELLHCQSQWFIHSFIYISKSPQLKSCPTKWGKHTVTFHGAAHRWKAYLQWGAAWFPKRIIDDTAVTTPLPCSLLHNTFHLGLGRPEPH
jgi:hypothetical protein